MNHLVAHIREVIEQHRKGDPHVDEAGSCSCGATHVPDHSDHLAQAIVDRLDLRSERADDARRVVGKKFRYVSALFDEEVTVLEGAE